MQNKWPTNIDGSFDNGCINLPHLSPIAETRARACLFSAWTEDLWILDGIADAFQEGRLASIRSPYDENVEVTDSAAEIDSFIHVGRHGVSAESEEESGEAYVTSGATWCRMPGHSHGVRTKVFKNVF